MDGDIIFCTAFKLLSENVKNCAFKERAVAVFDIYVLRIVSLKKCIFYLFQKILHPIFGFNTKLHEFTRKFDN